MRLVPYGDLASCCAELVADANARRALGAQGFARMKARDEKAYLASALGTAELVPAGVA